MELLLSIRIAGHSILTNFNNGLRLVFILDFLIAKLLTNEFPVRIKLNW